MTASFTQVGMLNGRLDVEPLMESEVYRRAVEKQRRRRDRVDLLQVAHRRRELDREQRRSDKNMDHFRAVDRKQEKKQDTPVHRKREGDNQQREARKAAHIQGMTVERPREKKDGEARQTTHIHERPVETPRAKELGKSKEALKDTQPTAAGTAAPAFAVLPSPTSPAESLSGPMTPPMAPQPAKTEKTENKAKNNKQDKTEKKEKNARKEQQRTWLITNAAVVFHTTCQDAKPLLEVIVAGLASSPMQEAKEEPPNEDPKAAELEESTSPPPSPTEEAPMWVSRFGEVDTALIGDPENRAAGDEAKETSQNEAAEDGPQNECADDSEESDQELGGRSQITPCPARLTWVRKLLANSDNGGNGKTRKQLKRACGCHPRFCGIIYHGCRVRKYT